MLVIVTGLPGTGKTTLARQLAANFDAVHLNTDIIRAALGLRGQYDQATKEKVYAEMLLQTEKVLKNQGRVVVDATFYKEALRAPYRALEKQYFQRMYWIEVQAEEAVIKERVNKKRTYSEADFEVYQAVKVMYEPLKDPHLVLHTDQQSLGEMIERVWQYLDEVND